ncbi:hypothetical protein Pryu01_01865 [Paraliobacillus ryukyuensis]|uniref:Uncharacterized protein n=1 Tax=Paraliobacillus ryukyuensis TaxID=200904 RepID=A0A366DUK1_9BACI|nr:DUF5412 family protein [Paraliobacillus ryukyuensis]RBO93169.1 hypothetical protein DES48_11335 [Paraliobacillus ryukyuensis]
MKKSDNAWSFYLILFCIVLVLYALYSNLANMWLIAPPNYILILLSLSALVLGIIGFKDKRSWWTKTRSWITVILSGLTSGMLFLIILLTLLISFMGGDQHIKTVHSPDGTYTIDFYRYDAGAAGSLGVRAELDGPLWFKKRIYYLNDRETVDVEWENNSTVSINKRSLDLKKGETYGYESWRWFN